ncbi:hypothetical protein FC56_GL000248 [Lentilactobacillus senioris DSM 24302 = JCM 17472]|uniref:Uncharacterized protein n=1 Tax=Lentilactobacillus senioris DSM 24302 = JCM 17472 TaxID=1423802 RepID=A0A0R2CP34_9LACO|nr:hypothetical protein [Lentilactobacillus senioris]KRM93535.1 hypothetical protein FC56_GL000248 [Lentilactobacillus senioris DSM 24302 = JCM 17472]
MVNSGHYNERVKQLDNKIQKAFAKGSPDGYIAGLMNRRNVWKIQLAKMEAMKNGRS